MAFAVKLIILRNPARAGSLKESILLRAVNPRSATFASILKDDTTLKWDPLLILNAILALFQTEIINAVKLERWNKAKQIQKDLNELLPMLVIDTISLNPKQLKALWAALISDNPVLSDILSIYKLQRMSSMQNSFNLVRNITYHMDVCLDYNLADCEDKNCKKLHACLLEHEIVTYHPLKFCPKNTARDKLRKQRIKAKRGRSWGFKRGNYSGRGRGFYNYNNFNQRDNERFEKRGNRDRFRR